MTILLLLNLKALPSPLDLLTSFTQKFTKLTVPTEINRILNILSHTAASTAY